MLPILFQIFFISSLINLFWEVIHSQLYTTCQKLSLNKYIPLIIKVSLKDGFWISIFYLISFYIFQSTNILLNTNQLILFILLALSFSFIDEKISLKMKRWEYTAEMPTIFKVGITPLLELAVTGTLTFLYIFLI